MQIYPKIHFQLARETDVVGFKYVKLVYNIISLDFVTLFVDHTNGLDYLLQEFLHRAADLTLVPSVAIANDLEEARVTAGATFHLSTKLINLLNYLRFEVKVRLLTSKTIS